MTRPSILFVDDEANLLNALRRVLRVRRDRWDMEFTDTGTAALDLLAVRPFDIVLSDMRMPGMDGADLLAEVERRHPASIRIILSGYAEEMSVLRTIGSAHRYLAKPMEPDALLSLLDHLTSSPHLTPDLLTAVAGRHGLPSPATLLARLAGMLAAPVLAMDAIAGLVMEDLALTAGLLKITNSAFFGGPTDHVGPLPAVRQLGEERLRRLFQGGGLFRSAVDTQTEAVQSLNRMARRRRHLARRLVGAGPLDERVELAAFLGDLGELIRCDITSEPVRNGVTTAETGAALLDLWGFAPAVVTAVRWQERPSAAPDPSDPLLAFAHLSLALAPERGVRLDEDWLAAAGYQEELPRWRQVAADYQWERCDE